MKITSLLLTLSIVSLTACSTLSRHTPRAPKEKQDTPETVIVTYHVKPGQEKLLQDTLARAWTIYQKEHMVAAQPHLILRDNDVGGTAKFLEIFTWAGHAAPAACP